ncbi:cysteine desufuration protein SufE [Stappia taiwanensis]|nr:cysteine desufuration protein SufE [Stappia taiwanensis]
MAAMTTTLDSILDDFAFLDDWEDRYKYVIELGRMLPPFPDDERTEANKIRGCVSQVWLTKSVERDPSGAPVLVYAGDSDAHIVKGLVAIVLAMFSGRTAQEIAETDVDAIFAQIGLKEHLTPQRSNGLKSMVESIKADARSVLAQA